MAIREILIIPDKILNIPCKKITEFDDELKRLATDLIDSLDAAQNPPGAGLSAPQIGVSKRICVARKFYTNPDNPENDYHKDTVLVNPEITGESSSTDVRWEACLSIPDIYGQVQRNKQIKVTAQDIEGNLIKIKAKGFFARVIQHEIDHLDGILFTTKVIGEIKNEKELDELYAN